MAQERYYNYGGTASNTAENLIHAALNTKGVYRGMDLSVDSNNNLLVAVGTGLLPDGILWRETVEFSIVFSAPGVATQYTLIATHADRNILGGVAVEYTLDGTGILTDNDVLNGVVLGWIYHPGGGAPLAQEHLVSSPKQLSLFNIPEQITTIPIELIPPLPRSVVSNVGVNVTVTPAAFDGGNFVVYQQVENSPTAVPAVQQAIQNISCYYAGYRPNEITVYTNFPAVPLTSMTIEVYDTSQAPVPVTNGVVTGTGAWVSQTATVDRVTGTFDDDKPYTIRLRYAVNQGAIIQLGRVLIKTSPYPTS